MRIFVSGASGFVGRAFVEAARARGHELLCLTRRAAPDGPAASRAARGDLDDVPWDRIERFAPEALVHLAWIATPGQYLESPENAYFLDRSRALMEGLAARGVRHLVGVGSCIEYAPSTTPLREDESPTLGDSAYAAAKCALHAWLEGPEAPAAAAVSWLRIFYPYGPGEHPGRITTTFLRSLARGEPVVLGTPGSIKDFVYIDDLARAICHVVESGLAGAVNLGTGEGTSIRGVAERAADAIGAPRSLVRDAEPAGRDPRPFVVADATRLRSTGWRPEVDLDEGLRRLATALGLAPR